MMKTYSVKPEDIKRETHVIDASGKILGRLATEIARLLMGKHKAIFSRNADIGDCVTVINAEKILVTGKKEQEKIYYWHSNYPGGFKQITYEKLMQQHPERALIFAVDGMLPHNHLHDRMMKRLQVYAGPEPVKSKQASVPVTVKAREKQIIIRNLPSEIKPKQKKEAKR